MAVAGPIPVIDPYRQQNQLNLVAGHSFAQLLAAAQQGLAWEHFPRVPSQDNKLNKQAGLAPAAPAAQRKTPSWASKLDFASNPNTPNQAQDAHNSNGSFTPMFEMKLRNANQHKLRPTPKPTPRPRPAMPAPAPGRTKPKPM